MARNYCGTMKRSPDFMIIFIIIVVVVIMTGVDHHRLCRHHHQHRRRHHHFYLESHRHWLGALQEPFPWLQLVQQIATTELQQSLTYPWDRFWIAIHDVYRNRYSSSIITTIHLSSWLYCCVSIHSQYPTIRGKRSQDAKSNEARSREVQRLVPPILFCGVGLRFLTARRKKR